MHERCTLRITSVNIRHAEKVIDLIPIRRLLGGSLAWRLDYVLGGDRRKQTAVAVTLVQVGADIKGVVLLRILLLLFYRQWLDVIRIAIPDV